MICIMAEKASAANHMILALSGTDGPNRFQREGEDICVSWASGHILEYAPPHLQVDPSLAWRYRRWDLGLLPWDAARLSWRRQAVPTRSASDAWDRLKRDLTEADEIVIATDDDPTGEGSLLAWEIIDQLGVGEDRLVTRMRFADEEPASLVEAFEERDTLIDSESDPDCRKATYRCRWDYLSMQLTRAATRMAGGSDSICRVGRLKSAMVTLVGDQEEARRTWVRRPTYQARYKDETGCVFTDEDEPYEESPDKVDLGRLGDDVVEVDGIRRRGNTPPDLPDLMAIAAVFAKRGMAADTFLSTYQALYEAGYVSYPRTEDKKVTQEQFEALKGDRLRIAAVCGVGLELLTHTEPRKRHVGEGLAHGAIRPGSKVPQDLSELDRYGEGASEIWRQVALGALRIFAEDYVYELTEAHIKGHPSFKGSSRRTLRPGWRDVLDDGGAKEQPVPGGKATAFVHEHVNKRPEEPSVDWIRKRLEKHDVGTGSTRVSTLADVCRADPKGRPGAAKPRRRRLMEQTKTGKISLTDLGRTVYDVTRGTSIADLATTERVQEAMRAAAAGTLSVDDAAADVTALVVHDIEVMAANVRRSGGEVPDGPVTERASGVFGGVLVDFPRTVLGHRLDDSEVEALLSGSEVFIEGLRAKDRVSGRIRVFDAPAKLSRTEDGRLYVAVDRRGWGVPDSFSGRILTQDERDRLQAGETVMLEGLVTRDGRTYRREVEWKDGRITFCKRELGAGGVWRRFSGHTFTDEEMGRLSAGEVLSDMQLRRTADGSTYVADIAWDPDARKIVFVSSSRADRPTRFSGHTFTDTEVEALLAGKRVMVENLVRKDGCTYSRELYWDAEAGKVEFVPRKGKGTTGAKGRKGSTRRGRKAS